MEDSKVILLKDLQITSMYARNVFPLLIAPLILNMVVDATCYGNHQICTLPIWQVAKFVLRIFLSPSNLTMVKFPLDNVIYTSVAVLYQEE